MRKKMWIYVLGLILLISGCVSTTGPSVKLVDYVQRPEDMRKAQILPPRYIIEKKRPRIAILDIADHSGLTQMKRCNLGQMATDLLHNVVFKMGRYEVVERAQAKKLAAELGYQETHGVDWEQIEKKYFALGQNVDYAIVGAVNRVTPSVNRDRTLKSCIEGAEVSLSLRIIDLRRGSTVASFIVKEKAENVKSLAQRCEVTCGLVQKSLENAISRWVPVKVQDAIPIYGYISKVMSYVDSNGKVVKKTAYINLGSKDGVRPGDKVVVMELRREKDFVTGKDRLRYIDLGKATVAQNRLMPDEAIIVIDSPDLMKRVKIGFVVQTTAERARKEAQQQKLFEGARNILNIWMNTNTTK